MVGWLVLIVSPLQPMLAQCVSACLIPVLFAIAYTVVILVFWPSVNGGFDSLAAVMTLFDSPWIALAGWLHYLAFDLFLGAWEVRTARRDGMPHTLVVPCLVLTFLFGPMGFLLFQSVRASRRLAAASTVGV